MKKFDAEKFYIECRTGMYGADWQDHDAATSHEHVEALEATVEAALNVCARPEALLFTLDTAERVCFYEQEFYVLSNFSAFKVRWKGIDFDTSEAAYHWERFKAAGPEHRAAIRYAWSAHEAYRYAQDNKRHQLQGWDAIKVDVMRDILRAKVDQHEYVRRKLLETGERELVENSWRDPFWGWGPNRDGKNMLGKLWMEIRAEISVPSPQRLFTATDVEQQLQDGLKRIADKKE